MRLLWYYLWLAPHFFQALLLFVMFRRKLIRQFPAFASYTAFEIIQTAFLFAVFQLNLHTGYSRLYYAALLLSTSLRFGVVDEVFNFQFRGHRALIELARVAFRGSMIVLLLLSLALAITGGRAPVEFISAFANVSDRTASVLQCGLLVFLFIFFRYLGVVWRERTFGIALGLGIFASVELATSAIRVAWGGSKYLDLITMGTYHCCVLIWLFYLWTPERKPVCTIESLPQHDLNAWDRQLQELTGK